jgi:hypothetical protein
MPELKHTFQGGKMEKDKDERIVPNGQYREALNISVSTSEDSDVGAAQNILGNICVTQAIRGRTQTNTTLSGLVNFEYDQENFHITQIVDPQSDMLYRFVHTPSESTGVWMDRIIEYDTTKSIDTPWQEKENAVVVDVFKVQATITTSSDVSNKTWIKVDKNTNQLRWGMRIKDSYGAVIEDIDYVTGEIWLDKLWAGSGSVIFEGDRSLNFDPDRNITGLNIIDGMLFWTDNYSEPKKIDIERAKMGSNTALWSTTTGLIGRYSGFPIPKIDDFNQHTVLVVKEEVKYDCIADDIFGGDRAYKQDTIIDDTLIVEPPEEETSIYEESETASFNLEEFQGTLPTYNQQEEVQENNS